MYEDRTPNYDPELHEEYIIIQHRPIASQSRTPKIPNGNSRKFLKFWRELRGIYRSFVFFEFLLLIMTF